MPYNKTNFGCVIKIQCMLLIFMILWFKVMHHKVTVIGNRENTTTLLPFCYSTVASNTCVCDDMMQTYSLQINYYKKTFTHAPTFKQPYLMKFYNNFMFTKHTSTVYQREFHLNPNNKQQQNIILQYITGSV